VQLPDLLNRYGDILTYLSIDLMAIFVMTYVLYFAGIGARICCCPTSR
jgi:hypothetical protein